MNKDHTMYRSAAGVALATGLLLMVPLLAMRFTDEVVWTPADFAVAGTLLFGAGFSYLLVARKADNTLYRAAAGVAVAAALILAWVSVSVGIIGADGDPANAMYFGVVAVGVIGALIARFRPRGMSLALLAMALAQTLVGAIAMIAGLGRPWSGPLQLTLLNGFFVALFVASAWLFRRAAYGQPQRVTT